MPRKKSFFAGRRHPNEQTIGLAVLNGLDNACFLLGREIAVFDASKLDRWMPLTNSSGRLLHYLRRCPEKVWLEPVIRTHRKEFAKQIDTRYTDIGRETETSRSPNDPHPVDAYDITIGDIRRKDGIATHVYELGYVDCDMLQSLPSTH